MPVQPRGPANSTYNHTSQPIVTLFESHCAGAAVVGPAVAAELGIHWIGQQIDSQAIEKFDSIYKRFRLNRFLHALNTGDSSTVAGHFLSRREENRAQVRELATNGGVLLGRNATVILADMPHALHVKLDAPREVRVKRAVNEYELPRDVAEARVEREDRLRAEISLALWGWDPRQTTHYDLVLNTETFGFDRCVEIIVTLARERMAAHSDTQNI